MEDTHEQKKVRKMRKVIIVGAGQNGHVIKAILGHWQTYRVLGFLDDKITGPDVLGRVSEFKHYLADCEFFIAIGKKRWRRESFDLLKASGARFVNAIHPSAVIEENVFIGRNVMIGALSYINTGAVISDDTLINNGCIVEHDCEIGVHCNINPGVVMGGGVVIGDNAFIGLGARLRDHISIGKGATIGMGSIVLKNVPAGTLFYNRLENVSK